MNETMPRWLHVFQLFASIALFVASCSGVPGGTLLSGTGTSTPAITVTTNTVPCTLFHTWVTPAAALGAEFEGHGHVSGLSNAPVTLIAFSDYQCTQCAILAASLKKVRLIHSNDVRLIYLHAPQAKNDKDTLAIQAVEAADLQGKFWEMHDLLFSKQVQWFGLAPADFEGWAASQASSLGLDPVRFRSDYEGTVVAGRLQQAVQFASSVQSFTPPLLFVNDTTPYTGLADFASLDMVIRLDALTALQYSSCPSQSVDPLKQYIATVHTADGDVELQLYPDKSPLAVSNFIFLVNSGWYNNNTFYRVTPGTSVMTGDPSGTGYGNPGYLFATEIPAGLNFDQPGMVAMDNNGPETNGSRFFITLAPESQMDGQFTIFGKVLSGLDVLSKLTARNPQPGVYLPPGDELISITIEKR
jgi:cyclophilin family peptidyl-prolyl cis-trans isomerase/protein-disulfide isomerase